jgi:predicted ATPase
VNAGMVGDVHWGGIVQGKGCMMDLDYDRMPGDGCVSFRIWVQYDHRAYKELRTQSVIPETSPTICQITWNSFFITVSCLKMLVTKVETY